LFSEEQEEIERMRTTNNEPVWPTLRMKEAQAEHSRAILERTQRLEHK